MHYKNQHTLDVATQTLLQYYANADATCGCGGHHKGNMNEDLRKLYALRLRALGIMVPMDIFEKFNKDFKTNIDMPEGEFNGIGSY